jgi:hypothetical protein
MKYRVFTLLRICPRYRRGCQSTTALAAVLLVLVLVVLALLGRQAQAGNPPVAGGGSCTGQTEIDSTQGAQQAYDNGLYTCASGSSWAAEALIVGSTLGGGTAASCTTTNAGMIQWTGSAFQGCNGTSWSTLGGGGINAGTQYQMALYDAATDIVGDSAITTDANNVLNIAGSSITASDPALNVTQTWNSAGTAFTGINETVTSTASAAASLLLNLVVGSTSEFSVDKSGDVTAAGYV